MRGIDAVGAAVTLWLLKAIFIGILGLYIFRWVIRINHWRDSARIAREDREQIRRELEREKGEAMSDRKR